MGSLLMEYGIRSAMKLWTPSEIDTVSWVDASDSENVVQSGGYLSELTDKSGNSNHLIQPTTTRQPEWKDSINGMKTAVFDGVDNALYSDNGIGPYMNSEFTMIGVIKRPTTATLISARNNTGDINRYYINGSSSTRISLTLGNTPVYSGTDVDDDTSFIFGFEKNGDDFRFVTNGVPESYVVNPTMGDDFYYFAIGCIYSGGTSYNNFSDVELGEYLVFDSHLSDTDRQKVEGYLAWRWGLESDLPSGHPYEDAAPTV